jgi:DNA-binding MarR family transcriptional regulator
MLEPSLHINTGDPIPPGALAMLPDEFSPVATQPQPEPTPDATSEAIELLFAEAVAFVNQGRKAFSQLPGEDALHSGERSILLVLEESGPCTVPQIARARSTSRQNVQVIINRLAAEGRVELRGNPSHKRSKLAALTVRGKEWLQAFEKTASRALPAKVKISTAEIQAAGQVLLRLRRALTEGLETGTRANRSTANATGKVNEPAGTKAETTAIPQSTGGS